MRVGVKEMEREREEGGKRKEGNRQTDRQTRFYYVALIGNVL